MLDQSAPIHKTSVPTHKTIYWVLMNVRNLLNLPSDHFLVQMARYGLVAIIAFIIDFGLLFVFTNYLHIFYLLSATLSFSVSLVANYHLSITWVFPDATGRAKHVQITLFTLIGISGLLLNTAVIGFCTSALGIYYLYSKLIATVIVFFWSFLSRRYLMAGKRAASVADKW